jgi:hypothetical protein
VARFRQTVARKLANVARNLLKAARITSIVARKIYNYFTVWIIGIAWLAFDKLWLII